ncbi:TonB-dependent receptor [Altererythrobacter sp. B11]|uniref:TonB-dependent receptor n=1 Tax=Altererythrobacter sp. B11 TaxID=2060312 RepID=UPI000DC73791|nr:TonB-dependent receptor [Altererythrobacter sp. B11]BBC71971.1 TonB-dependent receptor [Altererythrobacter sp. B11]
MKRHVSCAALKRHLLRTAALGTLAVAGTAHAEADDAATDADQIVVTGQRLSRESAIAAKKEADTVIDEIAADDLGKLPDANVADALARLPGVNVVVNQDTGEGEYVTIRGFSGTYNAVTINGVRVAQTDPSSRDVSLSVLPPNGLAAIRVTKTLTPDVDGDAIAGVIDFRTPTAFDFNKPTTLRLYATGGINGRAHSADEDSGVYQGQLDFAQKFGDGQFGIFASVNYGVTHGNAQETENDGEWEPYVWRKNSTETISEDNMHLPGIDLDYRRVKQTRYGGNISLDYHGDATQLYLRGQYARQELRGTNDYTDYRNRPTARLTQVDPEDTSLLQPEDMITGSDPTLGSIYGYTTGQIVDEDGDGIISDADRNSSKYWSLNGRSGVWNPQAFQFARNFGTIDVNQTLATVEFGGESKMDALTLTYSASYSGGTRENPDGYSVGYNCDKCTFPLDATGIDWVSSDPRFPHAGMPAFAEFVERDSSLLPFDGASHERWKQKDDRIALKLDARYDMDGVLSYVQAGAKWLRSKRDYDYTPLYDGDFAGTPLDGLNLEESGLVDKEVTSMLGGEYYYGDVFDRAAVVAAIRAAEAANGGDVSEEDLLQDDKKGSENVYAGYALANFDWDAFRLIAGARLEHRTIHNDFWVDDGDESGFGSSDSSYTIFLPSLTATYRPSNRVAIRGALWTGYSAPEYGNISGGQSITRDPVTDEIIAISQGNPDLKPAKAYNADLSLEYYPDPTSVVSVAAYYKHIKNFIFTNGNQVDAATTIGTIEITQPKNGETAKVYGVELNLIKGFDGLAAPFDGFGFEGNLTLQHSEAESGLDYREGDKMRLVNTPHILYNAALTFQKYGFEAKLSYNYRGKFIEDLRDNAVDKWVRPNRSLDLHTRYNITPSLAMDFDVGNLLNDWKYYTTKGDNPSYQKDYMEPGRTYLMRLSYVY